MPKIVFTAHARGKFTFFKRHKIVIHKNQVVQSIIKGNITDTSEYPKIQTAARFDKDHSLITIYRKDEKSITVITFWIAEKGRYESKIQ